MIWEYSVGRLARDYSGMVINIMSSRGLLSWELLTTCANFQRHRNACKLRAIIDIAQISRLPVAACFIRQGGQALLPICSESGKQTSVAALRGIRQECRRMQ
jgi:hypothetical protein